MIIQKFDVDGMSCANCVAHVEKAVKGLSGIGRVEVSLDTNSMTVEYDDGALNAKAIIDAVEEAGYEAKAAA